MPSDASLAHVDWARRTEPDDLPEWMDEPCSYEELRACLVDLGQINRLTFGYRPTLTFLQQLIARNKPSGTLRILDVGFGGGDTLHRIERWAKARQIPVALTGIDLNPNAARAAKERFGDTTIQWLSGDAFTYEGEADVILSSLLTHHLSTAYAVRFLQWMEHTAKLGWFINDLERSARSANLFGALARVMRWHRFVQHDGPVSFARSFVREDWQRMLAEARVPLGAAGIVRSFPSRLCVSRFK